MVYPTNENAHTHKQKISSRRRNDAMVLIAMILCALKISDIKATLYDKPKKQGEK